MLIAVLFWLLFASAIGLAIMQGKPEERAFAALLLLSVAATFLFNHRYGFLEARLFVLAIDTFVLAAALVLVARSSAYWPLWFAGFHAISVSSGLAASIFPEAVQTLYVDSAGFWAIPALIAFAGGVWLDNRQRDRTDAV